MNKLFATSAIFLALAYLTGCGSGKRIPSSQPAFACASAQARSSYSITLRQGPDFLDCKLTPLHAGVLSANVYVGSYPPAQPNLTFYGFTNSAVGPLAWFESTATKEVRDAAWVTYISTGYDSPSVIKLMVHARTEPKLEQLAHVASLVVGSSIGPNRSMQRTRYPRR